MTRENGVTQITFPGNPLWVKTTLKILIKTRTINAKSAAAWRSTECITALSAIDASTKWTITAPGSIIVLGITQSSSSCCFSYMFMFNAFWRATGCTCQQELINWSMCPLCHLFQVHNLNIWFKWNTRPKMRKEWSSRRTRGCSKSKFNSKRKIQAQSSA